MFKLRGPNRDSNRFPLRMTTPEVVSICTGLIVVSLCSLVGALYTPTLSLASASGLCLLSSITAAAAFALAIGA